MSADPHQPKPFTYWILRYDDPPDDAKFVRSHTKFAGKIHIEGTEQFVFLIAGDMGQEMVRRWNNHESLLEACKAFVEADLGSVQMERAYDLAVAAIEKASKG